MWEIVLKYTFHRMVSLGSDLYLTHLNRMALLKQRIGL